MSVGHSTRLTRSVIAIDGGLISACSAMPKKEGAVIEFDGRFVLTSKGIDGLSCAKPLSMVFEPAHSFCKLIQLTQHRRRYYRRYEELFQCAGDSVQVEPQKMIMMKPTEWLMDHRAIASMLTSSFDTNSFHRRFSGLLFPDLFGKHFGN